jgi:hypothetical protein
MIQYLLGPVTPKIDMCGRAVAGHEVDKLISKKKKVDMRFLDERRKI